PGLGMAVGAMAAAAIVVIAVIDPPRPPIVPARPADRRRHALVVIDGDLEGPALEDLARALSDEEELREPEVRVVAPSRHRFLDRWASDLDAGRVTAQQSLVLAVATLAALGLDASAHVGDEGVVQTVEDELRTFPATDVFLIGATGEDGPASEELAARLAPQLHLLPATEPRSTRVTHPV
ncbi:MAG TPA: hypothetical protein VFJ99_01355, partial [Solirubrobacterales bacterium]|nr:hypothetical protein [Solirubrobacterales bacterium]